MENRPIQRYQVIEIQIPTGTTATQFQIPDQPQLRNSRIWQIEAYINGNITKSPVSGSDLLSVADSQRCFLSLYEGDLERVKNIPLLRLNNMQTGTTTTPFVANASNFNGIIISWTKSFLKFWQAAPTGGVVVALGVTYTDENNL